MEQSIAAIEADFLRWATVFEKRLCLLELKAGFNPNQPRVPAGSSEGGQWTDGGSSFEDDAIEEVYPELLLPVARGIQGTRNFLKIRDAKNWALGKHKSVIKWNNRMREREWTKEQITETIEKGKRIKAPNFINKPNKAVRYEYNGRFVVRDEVTKEILQISDDNFIPSQIDK